jgi:integrase
MARKYLMSWEGHPYYRWVKMHKKTRYRVSCDDLNAPRTKEGSYQQANDWWLKKLATLQPAPPIEKQEALDDIARKIDYAANHAPELLPALKETREEILREPPGEKVLDDETTVAANLETARLMGITVPPDTDPVVLQHLFGDRRLWNERLNKTHKTAKDKTVGYQVEKFLDEQRHHQKPATHKEVAAYLRRLAENSNVWSAETNVETIDEQTVARHYVWLVSHNYTPKAHNKVLSFFRRFVEWLWSNGLLEKLPLNLKRKDHRKKVVYQEVEQFDHAKEAIDALPDPYKLWAYLGVNCGMTNADLGATRWEQIDTTKWTLTRRRVKTGDQPHTPTVRYKLWSETVKELKKLPHRKGLLFTTKTGKPLYETRYNDDGKPVIKDMFRLYWSRLEPKPVIPLKAFRSIGATTLNTDKVYRQYKDYYLAHAPRTVADQHYAAEADKPFFDALEFIRTEVLK